MSISPAILSNPNQSSKIDDASPQPDSRDKEKNSVGINREKRKFARWVPSASTSTGPLTVDSSLLKNPGDALAMARCLATPKDMEYLAKISPVDNIRNAGVYMLKALLSVMKVEQPMSSAQATIVNLQKELADCKDELKEQTKCKAEIDSLKAERQALLVVNEETKKKSNQFGYQLSVVENTLEKTKKNLEERNQTVSRLEAEIEKMKSVWEKSASESAKEKEKLEGRIEEITKEFEGYKTQANEDFVAIHADYRDQLKKLTTRVYESAFAKGYAKCEEDMAGDDSETADDPKSNAEYLLLLTRP